MNQTLMEADRCSWALQLSDSFELFASVVPQDSSIYWEQGGPKSLDWRQIWEELDGEGNIFSS